MRICMRPNLLDPFFASITSLSGIGPKVEQALYRRLLDRDDVPRLVDSLVSHADRRHRPQVPPETARRAARQRGDGEGDGGSPSRRRRPAAIACRYLDLCQRRDRRPRADLFPRPARITSKSSFRSARRATSPAPPPSMTGCCRWCIPTAWSTKRARRPARDRAGLSADRRPLREHDHARRWRPPWRRCRSFPNGRTSAWLAAQRLRGLQRSVAQRSIVRPTSPASSRTIPPARASPMTSCSPSQLALALVRASNKRQKARMHAGDGHLRKADHRRLALFADAVASIARSMPSSPISPSPSAWCGCCRAMSAPARPSWRCSPRRP